MANFFVDAPADAVVLLVQLADGGLLCYFLCLPWYPFLSDWLASSDVSSIQDLYQCLYLSLGIDDLSALPDISYKTSRLELATFCLALYLRPGPAHVNISESSNSINRARSERTSYDDGRALVGSSIQPGFVREALEREVTTLGQLLDRGIRSYTVAPEKYPGRFQASALNWSNVKRRIVRI